MLKRTLFSIALFAVLCGVWQMVFSPSKPDKKPASVGVSQWTPIARIPFYDTVIKKVFVPVNSVLPSDTVFLHVDTAEILNNYFTHRTYTEQYSDSAIEIEVSGSLLENQLVAQSVRYKTKTPLFPPSIAQVRLWGGLFGDTRQRIGVQLLLQDNRERLYALGYTQDKALHFSMTFPLYKTKKLH